MDKIAQKLIDASTRLSELYSFVSGFCESEVSIKIEPLLKFDEKIATHLNAKEILNNLYRAFDMLSFIMAEREQSASDIASSSYARNIKLGELMKKLDEAAHDLYRMAKLNPDLETPAEKRIRNTKNVSKMYEDFGLDVEIFQMLNPEFLLPTESYCTKDELPKDAIVVRIFVRNTQNLIVGIKKLIDRGYVRNHYPNLTPTIGVTDQLIDRYKLYTLYELEKESPTTILPAGSNNIFQKLDKNTYRRLVHYPTNDYVRNYSFLPFNQMMTDFENKRILQSRQDTSKAKFVQIDSWIIGNIKKKFVYDNKRLADALFETIYNDKMTDEQVIKLGISSFMIQESMTKDKKYLKENFNKSITTKTLKSLL